MDCATSNINCRKTSGVNLLATVKAVNNLRVRRNKLVDNSLCVSDVNSTFKCFMTRKEINIKGDEGDDEDDNSVDVK